MRKTCALTGHRELPAAFDRNRLYDGLEELIRGGCDRFLCGMARGFDLTALACLADLKEKYKISLVACIPFAGQERGFCERDRREYLRLLDACDEKIVLCEEYRAGCLLARDRYMADRADVVYAYCTRTEGGAAYTVSYARKKGVKVVLYEE